MLLLLAELNAKPSTADEVEKVLKGLVDVARKEVGCVFYAAHRKWSHTNDFVVYELYRDSGACDAHLASPQVQRAISQFETLLVAPPRVVYCTTVDATGFEKISAAS